MAAGAFKQLVLCLIHNKAAPTPKVQYATTNCYVDSFSFRCKYGGDVYSYKIFFGISCSGPLPDQGNIPFENSIGARIHHIKIGSGR